MKCLSITKPGIIFGNIVTVCGGFFLASHTHFSLLLLLYTLLGMALIIASGCVLNNLFDHDIDRLMQRTQTRPTAQGLVSIPWALSYAIALGMLGFALLYFKTNLLTVCVAALGLFFYVLVYTLYFKRHSSLGTLIGAIAGAVPPVVGYCAVTNHFDLAALLLFLILFFWQMPHFYAIALYRLDDFKAAGLPILPLSKSISYTKKAMFAYTLAFTCVALMPTLLGYTGWVYFAVALILSLLWLYFCFQGFTTQEDRPWARKVFLFSILNITLLSLFMLNGP